MTRISKIALCLILGFALWNCTKSGPVSSSKAAAEQRSPRIDVYYFHRTARCPSCEKIERLAESVVNERFADALASGTMTWRAINIDEPQNQHFEEEYRLEMQSVIVSETFGGKEARWKNLDKVWDLLDDDEAFRRYVADEIGKILKGLPQNRVDN